MDVVHDDEKGVSKVYTPGGPQVMVIISESGLYTLTTRSNKPQARPFRKWVMAEVPPRHPQDRLSPPKPYRIVTRNLSGDLHSLFDEVKDLSTHPHSSFWSRGQSLNIPPVNRAAH